MKTCDCCENYFCEPTQSSPCELCLTKKGHKGFKRAKLSTQVKIWLRQFNLVVRGGR